MIDKHRILRKSVIIPIILIFTCALILSLLFGAISNQVAKTNLTQELREEVSQKGIMMEDYLQPEIALAKKTSKVLIVC